MATSSAATVEEYLAELPPERADVVRSVRDVILETAYADAGIKFDMGKSCLRFRDLSGIDLDAVDDIVASVPPERYIAMYEASRAR